MFWITRYLLHLFLFLHTLSVTAPVLALPQSPEQGQGQAQIPLRFPSPPPPHSHLSPLSSPPPPPSSPLPSFPEDDLPIPIPPNPLPIPISSYIPLPIRIPLSRLFESLLQVLASLGLNVKKEPDVVITPTPAPPDEREDDVGKGWLDPRVNGGRLLDFTTPSKGEPLNVIISGKSDPYVLTEEGFKVWAKSISFSSECLGLHYGHIHVADLGDGDGKKDEQYLARQDYFPIWGTCWESLAGGNHFRAWHQNGTLAASNAWFLAVSKEEHSGRNHMIVPDGYNLGRNHLVSKAIAGSRWAGKWWRADVEWRMGLLEEGSEGVNHGIEQDGLVAILVVNRL